MYEPLGLKFHTRLFSLLMKMNKQNKFLQRESLSVVITTLPHVYILPWCVESCAYVISCVCVGDMSAYVCVYVCVCMYVCVHMCMYVCTYV